jgi:hypothetical protein
MAQLPLIRTAADIPILMPKWKSQLDPVIAGSIASGVQVSHVSLSNTPTVVPHTLGQVPKGWVVSDLSDNAVVYRASPMTSSSVTLVATAPCVVSLWIY